MLLDLLDISLELGEDMLIKGCDRGRSVDRGAWQSGTRGTWSTTYSFYKPATSRRYRTVELFGGSVSVCDRLTVVDSSRMVVDVAISPTLGASPHS